MPAVKTTPAMTDVQRQLQRLNEVPAGAHRVVSCYLKLEPRDRARGKYLIKLKNRIRAVEAGLERLGLDRAIREAVTRDLQRMQEHFRSPGQLPAAQGVALFACEPLGLFEVLALPRVHRSRLAVDRTPLVRELVAVDEEFGRIAAAVVDRTTARLFEVTAFGAAELPPITANSTRGGKFRGDQDAPGWGEHAYHNRIREEKQRHFDRIAQHLFALDRRSPFRGIVLAGTGTDATAVQPFLHPYLLDRLFGSARLNVKDATPATVQAAVLEVREEFERTAERLRVHEMEEGLGSGWAVNGVRPVLRALARGQVRTLLVDAEASAPGFRGAESGQLALAARDVRENGEPLPVVDVVDDAIEEALAQRVAVDVVHAPEAAEAIDGMAALLRFR